MSLSKRAEYKEKRECKPVSPGGLNKKVHGAEPLKIADNIMAITTEHIPAGRQNNTHTVYVQNN